MSMAKVLSVLVSAVQQVKEAYVRSPSVKLNSTEVNVKFNDIDDFLLLEHSIIEQPPIVPLLRESINNRESLDQANEYSSAVRPEI